MAASTVTAKEMVRVRAPAWLLLSGLALFALVLRGALIWRTGFDGLYGQDPFAYLDYAAALKDALTHGQPPPPFFWPIGYPALAVLLSTLVPVGVATQVVSIVSGMLIAVLAFLIVREILGDQPYVLAGALFAGVIVASAGQLLISSLCTMSDAASLFAATLSAFGMLRFRRTRAQRWIALAAFALGAAVATRWIYALLIPVWGIAVVMERLKARAFLATALVASLFFLLALLPQGLVFLAQASRGNVAYVGDAQVYGWNPLNALRSDIVNADGHFTYSWSISNFYSLPLIQPDYVPLWFTPLVFLGGWVLRRRREFIVLLGWFAMMWGFLIGVAWENWRFPLAFFPPLAVLAGVGLAGLFRQMPLRRTYLVGSWLVIGLVVMVAWGWQDADAFIGRQLDERSIVSWLDARVPPDATILTFGETATLEHFTSFHVREMASESTGSVEGIAREGKDVFVLLDVHNVESQWQGLAPQVNFLALQEHYNLATIASRGGYVLFAVESKP